MLVVVYFFVLFISTCILFNVEVVSNIYNFNFISEFSYERMYFYIELVWGFLSCWVFCFFWSRWCCFVGLSFCLWTRVISSDIRSVSAVIRVGRRFLCLLLLWCSWVLFSWFLLFIFIVRWCVIKLNGIIGRSRSCISLRFSWTGTSVVCRWCEASFCGLRVSR